MKAFVMQRIGEVATVEKPIPEPGPNDAVVRTTAALICTSDTHTVRGAIGDRHALTLGHESVGVIHRLGSQVTGFREGQRVAVSAITPCFTCENCLRGFPSQCTQMLGGWKFANLKDGALAEYFHVNQAVANLAPIPDSVPDEKAVYACDMMSTGFMGAENAGVPLGGTAVVFGAGPVGLMAVAGLILLGASEVYAVETVPKRQELARQFGAQAVIDFASGDPVPEILQRTGGRGVDAAIEALGSEATFINCVRATRPGGVISNVGYHGDGEYVRIPRIDWGVGMGDKTIRTGLCPGGRERMGRLLRLLELGRIDPSVLTTHRFTFDGVERAFRLMESKADGVLKPLILFS
ncbi:MAG: NAD(P)-dependent alcohol dehydrogenase [Thermoplasmata archaeon]